MSPSAVSTGPMALARPNGFHASNPTHDVDEVYDILGIGFGPANLALAICLRERYAHHGLKVKFLERQQRFGWHLSLLLPGSTLQVSHFKDLATMRDPTSTFTFVNYLKEKGRLVHFINREDQTPSRREWSGYLGWAASRCADVVSYSQRVVSVSPSTPLSTGVPAPPTIFQVVSLDETSGATKVRLARNVVAAAGGHAVVPNVFRPLMYGNLAEPTLDGQDVTPFERVDGPGRKDGPKLIPSATSPPSGVERVIHSSTYLPSLNQLFPDIVQTPSVPAPKTDFFPDGPLASLASPPRHGPPKRLAVVGAGQSGVEVLLHLHSLFPDAKVDLIIRTSALVPSDDSGFVNAAAFDPDRTESFYAAGDAERDEWRAEFRRTNYGVVKKDVLQHLHELLYDQEVEATPLAYSGSSAPSRGRIEILSNQDIVEAKFVDDAMSPSFPLLIAGGLISNGLQHSRGGVDGHGSHPSSASSSPPSDTLPSSPDSATFPHGTEPTQIGLTLQHNKTHVVSRPEAYDAVFLATGFDRHASLLPFLAPLRDIYPGLRPLGPEMTPAGPGVGVKLSDGKAARTVTRDYRLLARDEAMRSSDGGEARDEADSSPPAAGLYVLGGNERTHGIGDSLLSLVAVRAGEVAESIEKRLRRRRDGPLGRA